MYGMDGSASSTVGGFQAMTQDMLTVLNDIPFSIPPYLALLARAVVTLEGIALQVNPDYSLVTEAYPFVARKLLREDRPEIQRALVQVLYAKGEMLKGERLAVILNSAIGVVSRNQDAFIDLDTIPENAAGIRDILRYVLSPKANSLRGILSNELVTAADLFLRQAARRTFRRAENTLQPPAPFNAFLPNPVSVPQPVLLPTRDGTPLPAFMAPRDVLEAAAPALDREEEVYALSIMELAKDFVGEDVANLLNGENVDPRAAATLILTMFASGTAPELPGIDATQASQIAKQLESLGLTLQPGQQAPDDLVEALKDLGEDERKALAEVSNEISQRLWNRLVDRVSVVSGQSGIRMPSAFQA